MTIAEKKLKIIRWVLDAEEFEFEIIEEYFYKLQSEPHPGQETTEQGVQDYE